MKGTVVLINRSRGMAALVTASGEHTSFEILGPYDIDPGDILTGDLESLGEETWNNETKLEEIDVFVEDIYGSKQVALRIIS